MGATTTETQLHSRLGTPDEEHVCILHPWKWRGFDLHWLVLLPAVRSCLGLCRGALHCTSFHPLLPDDALPTPHLVIRSTRQSARVQSAIEKRRLDCILAPPSFELRTAAEANCILNYSCWDALCNMRLVIYVHIFLVIYLRLLQGCSWSHIFCPLLLKSCLLGYGAKLIMCVSVIMPLLLYTWIL